ncbi:MAG: hypothetical protein DLM66_00230 [Candidatus Dormiibacter spiritus]|nr:MAG: hypothetical protein DLM66_00230 [Candidatus Dormibacteraeota bacterium]
MADDDDLGRAFRYISPETGAWTFTSRALQDRHSPIPEYEPRELEIIDWWLQEFRVPVPTAAIRRLAQRLAEGEGSTAVDGSEPLHR